ncbi:DUF4916 domain-containing protein [Streptomyces sp. NPDC005251]|uniref:DUF4916 domain-containing protein n=1 Tax=Streptomyces sp. NPDC005251 TaxID=3157166 RepID=UPI0033BC00C5
MEKDVVGAGSRWIPQAEYDLIQSRVPIVCADLLVLSAHHEPAVGLILRDTYDNQQGWCLIGGSVLRDEPITSAVTRHLKATLGSNFHLDVSAARMCGVVEYFSKPKIGEFYDPRKHAVAITFAAPCLGDPEPQGEAIDFKWFRQSELADLQFGFGQGRVVEGALAGVIGISFWK